MFSLDQRGWRLDHLVLTLQYALNKFLFKVEFAFYNAQFTTLCIPLTISFQLPLMMKSFTVSELPLAPSLSLPPLVQRSLV